MKIEIFCCYAYEDEAFYQSLKKQLRFLEGRKRLVVRSNHDIHPGANWKREIDEQLLTADIILLFISPDFLNSDYDYYEETGIQQAMERHNWGKTRVIPVLLRPVHWQETPFEELQPLPRNRQWISLSPNSDEVFFQITEELQTVAEEIASGKTSEKGDAFLSFTSGLSPRPETGLKILSPLRQLVQHVRYRKNYGQTLSTRFRHVDLTGFDTLPPVALALEQVFVDLSIVPISPHQASPDPISNSRFNERHSIWHYLASKKLAGQHFVIVGAPGSGKTTLLKYLASCLATSTKWKGFFSRPHLLPVFLSLRDHQESISRMEGFSLEAAAFHQLRAHFPLWWFQHQFTKGRCLILLDGLDEVADETRRRQVSEWICTQMERYPSNRFLLTSRPFGYQKENWLPGVTTLEILPLNFQQMTRSIEGWCLANEAQHPQQKRREQRKGAQQKATEILGLLRATPSLLEIAANPLLLTMLVTVHQYRGTLPLKRGELYSEICHVFLEKRSEAWGPATIFTASQTQQLLQLLAYTMMTEGRRTLSLQEIDHIIARPLHQIHPHMSAKVFLRLVEEASGLVLEQDDGFYRFVHLTLQEYLAAAYIQEEKMEHVLIAHVRDSWWRETIRLYCTQAADATNVLQACLEGSPPSMEGLVQAFECLEDEPTLQPEVQVQLDTITEDADPQRRRVAAEALLARRLHRMIPQSHNMYRDNSLITCAEYQLFVDERRAQGHHHQPDHWTTFFFPKGSGKMPILGVRYSDAEAFCEWLTARDREGWRYRLPLRGEWPAEERKQWKGLSAETGYWTMQKENSGEVDAWTALYRRKTPWWSNEEPVYHIPNKLRFEWVQGKWPEKYEQYLALIRDDIRELLVDDSHTRDHKMIFEALAEIFKDHACACDIDGLFDRAFALDRVYAAIKADAESWNRDSAERIRDIALLRADANNLARNLVFDRKYPAEPHKSIADASEIALTLVEKLTITLLAVWDNYEWARVVTDTLTLPQTRYEREALQHVKQALYLYIGVYLLKKRMEGNFPAHEGILLVKESR